MLEINIPRYGNLNLEHLVLDFNGTLSFNGELINGVAEALAHLSNQLKVHVLTADTLE
jgi:soluble P-type ATPase